jgi:predicted DNA-binding transcriptional regulator AlpA
MSPQPDDRVIWRPDLQDSMHVSSETVRRWINSGKLPKPDVAMSRRTMGWRLSTLRAAGINLA